MFDEIYRSFWRNNILLEVVIPTYNRVDNLTLLITNLLKSTNCDVSISIVDNDPSNLLSTDFIESNNINRIPIRVLRNKIHLGPDASILRSIEIAESDWIYCLGDSKIPVENAFDLMVNDIKRNSDISSIVYKFKNSNEYARTISNVIEIANQDIHWGDFFLVGNSVINSKLVKNHFSTATQFTLTRSMLFIFHILALKNNDKILLSANRIVKEFVEKPIFYNPGLSLLECWAQFPLLVNLPIKDKERMIVIDKIIKGESRDDITIFYKFCLIKIFRENIDISFILKNILVYRYCYKVFSFQKIIITVLYYTSKFNFFIRGS